MSSKQVSIFAAPYWSAVSFLVSSCTAYFFFPSATNFIKSVCRNLGIVATSSVTAFLTYEFVNTIQNRGFFANYFQEFDRKLRQWIRDNGGTFTVPLSFTNNSISNSSYTSDSQKDMRQIEMRHYKNAINLQNDYAQFSVQRENDHKNYLSWHNSVMMR